MRPKRRPGRLPDREARALARVFAAAVDEIHTELLGALDANERGDADPIADLKAKWSAIAQRGLDSRITNLVERITTRLARAADRVVRRSIPRIKAAELIGEPHTNRIVVQTVALIKEIGRVHYGELAATFSDPGFRGLASEAKAKILKERLGATKAKAEFWARDQTLTNHSQIVQQRARMVGLDRYEWITSNDERVREEHAALNGQVFRIGDPPPVGAPGEDYNCRCTMSLLAPGERSEA